MKIFFYIKIWGLIFAKVSTIIYTQNDSIKPSVKCKHRGRKYDFVFLSSGLSLPLTIRHVKLWFKTFWTNIRLVINISFHLSHVTGTCFHCLLFKLVEYICLFVRHNNGAILLLRNTVCSLKRNKSLTFVATDLAPIQLLSLYAFTRKPIRIIVQGASGWLKSEILS